MIPDGALQKYLEQRDARDDMASVYRERISNERLQAVIDHVRRWLFGADSEATQ